MDKEQSSRMLDVIAFLNARFLDDEMAAIELLGLREYTDSLSEQELMESGERLTDILIGMTDFAISAVKAMAMMVGAPPEKMIETLCLQLALAIK